MPNTFEDYIIAVKSKYEVEKNKIYSDFLLKPSPAQLREFCLLILDHEMSTKDREVFEIFFKVKPDSTLRKSIDNIDVEKFKKICNFLNGKSFSTSQNSLNLIAILVDYELRPFSYFLKSEIKKETTEVEIITKPYDKIKSLFDQQEYQKISPKSNFKKKIAIGFMGLIGITSIGYTTKNTLFKDKECMQWQKNHYEYVDCDKKELLEIYPIIPVDESLINLKKIDVNIQTKFFRNGKPIVWYCKHNNNKLVFYNSFGFDPETGKPLKAITNYMINKYVK